MPEPKRLDSMPQPKPRKRELRVESQQVGGLELLTPEELAAIDLPVGRTKTDIIRERQHLFTHMAHATKLDKAVAQPHVKALQGAEVTIHGHVYRIDRFLGRGYSGVALEVKRLDNDETAAVKLTRPYDHKRLNQTTFANQDEAEATAMARSMMNEIASLHTLTRDATGQPLQRHGGEPPFPILIEAQLMRNPSAANDGIYMAGVVQERIHGKSLEKIVRDEGRLYNQIDRVKKISLGLVRAVRRMHDAGVLHLDLKSANVVITADDDPIILDFGSSQQPKKWAGTKSGKPIRWAEPLSVRAYTDRYTTRQDRQGQPREANDVYSLGITLRDMIYGLDDTIDQTAIKTQLAPELQILDAVIEQMTRPDPDQRPNLKDIEQQFVNGWQMLQDSAAEAAVRRKIAS